MTPFDLFAAEARAIARLAELQRLTDPLRRPATYRVDFYLAYAGGGEHRAATHQAADDLQLARRMAHSWVTGPAKPTTTRRALIVETKVVEQQGPEVLDLSPAELGRPTSQPGGRYTRSRQPAAARPFFDVMGEEEQASHLEADHDSPGWGAHTRADREMTHVEFHGQDDAGHYHDDREEAHT